MGVYDPLATHPLPARVELLHLALGAGLPRTGLRRALRVRPRPRIRQLRLERAQRRLRRLDLALQDALSAKSILGESAAVGRPRTLLLYLLLFRNRSRRRLRGSQRRGALLPCLH